MATQKIELLKDAAGRKAGERINATPAAIAHAGQTPGMVTDRAIKQPHATK
jgi:hypothetical protein